MSLLLPGRLGKLVRGSLKMKRHKQAGAVAQLVARLPHVHRPWLQSPVRKMLTITAGPVRWLGKALATKPDDPSSKPRTHVMEREN